MSLSLYRCKHEEIILHGELKGFVTDATSYEPIQDALVKLNQSDDTVRTEIDGAYLFKGLSPGDYEIESSKYGYSGETKSAKIISAQITDCNFALEEIPVMHYSPTTLEFGFNLTSLSFAVSKTGSGIVSYSITPSKDWINVNPVVGVVENETDTINVNINRTGLTQTFINEYIIIRSGYLQHEYKDTINVSIKVYNPIIFNPDLSYGTVTDIEGNLYKTIGIGSQTWMAENIKTTKYNDNTTILLVENNLEWKNLITPAYCWYNNDENNKYLYGALYNWYAVMTDKLCPQDWHVPTNEEWIILTDYLGGAQIAGGKMKEIGLIHWQDPNLGADNSSGFTALPGEFRFNSGSFASIKLGDWWTATQNESSIPWNWNIGNSTAGIYGRTDLTKAAGLSVRCVKNSSQ
jgi:uncharacterized protein (TIGR02145 family)